MAANYAFKYATATKADLIRKARRGANLTNFQAPTAISDLVKREPKGEFTRAVFTNDAVYDDLTDIAESQDSNIKSGDITEYEGRVKFRKRPVIRVPYLNADASNPFYCLNFKALRVLKDPSREGPLGNTREVSTEQVTTMVRPYMWKKTWICFERKSQMVGSLLNKQGT